MKKKMNEKEKIENLRNSSIFQEKIKYQSSIFFSSLIIAGLLEININEYKKYKFIDNIVNSYIQEIQTRNDSINQANKNWKFYEHKLELEDIIK